VSPRRNRTDTWLPAFLSAAANVASGCAIVVPAFVSFPLDAT